MKLVGAVAPAWPAVAGLGSLAVAAVLVLVVTPRWRHEAEAQLMTLGQVKAARASLEGRAAANSVAVGAAVGAAASPAASAPASAAPLWPAAAASPRRAAALSALARRQGLELLQVREQVDAASYLQLSMNGRARYPALRQFVEQALAADPALVLDRLRLHRGEADATLVDFELQWTLLHRASPGRAALRPSLQMDAGPRP